MAFTTDLIGLLDDLKDLISSNVTGQQTTTITSGQDVIEVSTTCAYADGDTVLIYPSDQQDETEAYERQVMAMDATHLWLSSALPVDLPNAIIIRRIGGQYCRNIYAGNPPHVESFPAIVIHGAVVDATPMALAGTSSVTYAITLSTFTTAPDYETAHRAAWAIAKEIEQAITLQVNPTPCRPIWRSKIIDITQDEQVNAHSTLKVVHIHYSAEEMLQRFAKEPAILKAIGQTP